MLRPLVGLCGGALLLLASFWHVSAPTALSTSVSGPLHASGARILDAHGQEVRLTGVNWFGFETDTFAPHGLWTRNYAEMLDQVAASGFNTVRLPFSNQLFESTSLPRGIDYAKNPQLRGFSGLQLMDQMVAAAGQRGLNVLLDRHRPTAARQSELWYTSEVPEARWIEDWVMLAQHYAGNPTVIGADLHNEPHGPATWGDGSLLTDWRLAAEHAGNAILSVNPDWLIVVEGIEHRDNDWYWWGGNLAAAKEAPVRLVLPEKLVYSTHDYGPGVYRQAWFGALDFPSNLPRIWREHWAYLQQEGIAPVLVGEFGGRSVGSDGEGVWQRSLLAFLKDNNLSYTYWAWNPDSGDTGGILADDWSTLDQRKLAMLSAYQWPREAVQPGVQAIAQQPPSTFEPPLNVGGISIAQPAMTLPSFAPGGPFDPDPQHAVQGIGGPADPDAVHRQARERDEQRYLAEFGKPWPLAAYATSTAGT